MTADNIRALRQICILAMVSSILFLVISFLNKGYAVNIYRFAAIGNLLISGFVFIGLYINQKNIQLSFHRFHAVMFLYIIWLTFYGIVTSVTDSLNHGGFISFLITQIWAYDLIFIPPFVSVIFCGIGFGIFLSIIPHFMFFPFAKYIECMIFYLTIVSVNFFHYRASISKLSEQEKIMDDNNRLDILSMTDQLTNINNRNTLSVSIGRFVHHNLCVMMADIDNFKHFNDTYGHLSGDQILNEFAQALRSEFGQECVFRYGGDEFLVIRPEETEKKFNEHIIRINWMLANSHTDYPTSSYGYVWGRCESEEDLKKMIEEADRQLYEAKDGGRSRICGRPSAV